MASSQSDVAVKEHQGQQTNDDFIKLEVHYNDKTMTYQLPMEIDSWTDEI